MTRFRIETFDRGGRRQVSDVDAASREGAARLASAAGGRVLSIRAIRDREPFWRRELFSGGGRMRATDRMRVLKDLTMLLQAQLTVDRALRLTLRQAPVRARPLVETVLADVLSGVPLSRALRRHPNDFPADIVEIVAAGETSGRLAEVLADLVVSLERQAEIRRTVVSALIYPSLLMVMAFGIVALVIGVLVPSLAPLFDQPGVEPPAVIRFVTAGETFLAARWPLLAALVGSVAAVAASVWRRPAFAAARERALFALPLIGPVLLASDAVRLSRVLGTLLSADVPLPAAIAAAAAVPRSRAFRAVLATAARRIPEGVRLSAALGGLEALSPVMLRMVATGEEVNRQGQMLLQAARLHEEALETRIDRLFAVMTPVITGILGVVIGALILSIMSAVFSVNDLAAR